MEELIPIFFFMTVGAVMILRPITKRLGHLIEAMARDRQVQRTDDAELTRLRVVMEHLAKRIDLMEERLDFTERLVGDRRGAAHARPAISDTLPRRSEADLLHR